MLGVAVLFVVFTYCYVALIVPTYDYYGLGWRDPPPYMLVAALLMNLTIAYLADPVFRRPSQLFLVVQYLVVFLPASVVCLNVTLPSLDQERVFTMLCFMFFGLLIQTLFNDPGHASVRIPSIRLWTAKQTLGALAIFCLAIMVMMLYQLGNIFSLTNLESMYDQREILDDQAVNAALRYSMSWLLYLVLPVLLVVSFAARGRRRWLLLCACLGAFLLLYGIVATKSALLGPAIVGLIYWVLRPGPSSFILRFACGMTVLLMLPLLLAGIQALELLSVLYVGVVNFRMFAVPQALYVQYLDFFATHPNTLGSHVGLISWFVTYPLDAPVFLLIGDYYYPGSNQTANAGAWAQDGIAGFGLSGILLISGLLTVCMRILDSAAREHDARMVAAALSMIALAVCNVSFFTVLLSGGLGIAIALLYLTKGSPAGAGSTRFGSVGASASR